MSTQELLELSERYDTSRSIRWNAEKLNVTKRTAEDILLVNNVKSYFKTNCEDKMSIQNVKTNCEDKMSIQNVKTKCLYKM